ncbi:Flavodoxin-like protein [Thermobaculum terrenum ATCC BAA-798]|uniref:Flavodoxin-like protein n=1 Tax=Thermobaculum terrenum (strain ATCC BAA-798 / CCMEE 7001 / YNP1) TaxID=525904 RepID=D1CI80_THET1|nr:flavodoxin domain-containing protein [Thermobaculum terrenum]ACZ43451.1 Flavodoxin-like protein [Thermobaculum terrenum ATCC BAA-798]
MKVLVAYASRLGSTAEVAEFMGEELRRLGAEVDVMPVGEVRRVAPYDAVLVGSGVRHMHWLPEATEFVRVYQDELSRKPVALFLLSMVMSTDTAQHRQEAMRMLEDVRQMVRPVAVGLFGGEVAGRMVPFMSRQQVGLPRSEEHDFRDWEAMRSWVQQVYRQLARLSGHSAADKEVKDE